jgi:hypothetical protein
MRRSFRLAVTVVVLAPLAARAQGATACAAANSDGCQKAEDMYKYMLPQLGLGLAGGNPVLGSSSVLGKLGHFSLGARVSAFKGSLPQFDNANVSQTGRVASDIEVKESWLGGGGADAAIGLFGGFPVGVTHVGALDALASVMYLPDIGDNSGDTGGGSSGDPHVTIKTHTRFGFGGRVGLLDESFAIPAVSVAYLQRGLPKISLSAQTDNGADLGVEDLDVTVATWRVIATKNFLAFSFTGGFGGDSYKADGAITAKASGVAATDRSTLKQTITRTNWFVDLTLNAGPAKIGFEYGKGSKADIDTFNRFEPAAGASLTYYSFGLRFGF